MYNPYVGRGRNGEVRKQRTSDLKPQGGKKKHGSHRSHIIGKVKFNPSKVTELHQPGVIWN
jgi:hypothetical protein